MWRQVIRPLLHRPGLALLTVAGIALGISVFLAIRMANASAIQSFVSATDLAAGRAHLEVRGEIPEALFPVVAGVEGVRSAAPLVEGMVPVEGAGGEFLRVVGVDIFRAAEFFSFEVGQPGRGEVDFEDWLRRPRQMAVDPAWRDELAPTGEVDVLASRGITRVGVGWNLTSPAGSARADGVAVMDIGWAQELFGLQGKLTAIQIRLDDESRAEDIAEQIRTIIPGGLRVERPMGRNDDLMKMTGAFQMNLTAMSLVSVVVGMFLIYNSIRARVIQRQRDIAILRSLGASRIEIRGLFLSEALLLGLIGSLVGIGFAPILAKLAAEPVSLTISSLYEVVRAGIPVLQPGDIALGVLTGSVAAFLAAWLPASEAANLEPGKILHEGAGLQVFAPARSRLYLIGICLLAVAALCSWLAVNGAGGWLGFVSAAGVLGAFSCFVPFFARLASSLGRPLGLVGRLAADTLDRSLHRSGVTIAALASAVSMAVAVSVMIFSFRASVERWVDHTLMADLFVAPAANEIIGLSTFLPDGLDQWMAAQPGVTEVATFREVPIRHGEHPANLAVINGRARGDIEFLAGSAPDAATLLTRGAGVALSESFVNRTGHTGKSITLPTPQGNRQFPVVGTYKDYTRDMGTILIARPYFESIWPDPRLHSLAVYLEPGTDPDGLIDRLKSEFPDGLLAGYDNRNLKSRVYEIFDQTFAVTNALRGIAVVVAVIGIAFSTAVLVAERRRETAVFRAIGASRGQVTATFLGEALLVGLAACLAGMAGGVVLAMVLTWVVNLAFFGWTIALTYPIDSLLMTPVWVLPSAVAAGLIPAIRSAGTPPAAAVRFE